MLSTSVVLVAIPEDAISEIRSIIGDDAVHVAISLNDAEGLVEGTPNICLLVAVPPKSDSPELSELARLLASFPHLRVIALVDAGVASYTAVLRLGAMGVREVVFMTPHIEQHVLRAALERCGTEAVAARAWHRAQLVLPPALAPLLDAAVQCAHQPLSTVQLAQAVGTSERSLRRWCAEQQLPSPQWIVGWARLLLVAYYLDEPGRTVASIAHVLGYPSSCAVRNHLRRYTGVGASSLRAQGASQQVARLLERAVDAATPNEGPGRAIPGVRLQLLK